MKKIIPHNRPSLGDEEWQSIKSVIDSGWINYGEVGKVLENALSQYIYGNEDGNCVIASSGTASLYLALLALKIKKGDEVIIPCYACTALLDAVFHCGATPVLTDIDKETLSLTYETIYTKVTSNTKAIIVVHTFGIATELNQFDKLGLPIIEDCCQSLGTQFSDGEMTGSKGELAVFSFYASKLITGGYGGGVISKNKSYLEEIKDYLMYDSPESYKPRFNFQYSDINSAIVLTQLNNFAKKLEKRKFIAEQYNLRIIQNPLFQCKKTNNNFRFLLKFNSYNELVNLQSAISNVISSIVPIEFKELLSQYLNSEKKFPVSELASKTILSIPIYPELSKQDVTLIIRQINDYVSSSTSI